MSFNSQDGTSQLFLVRIRAEDAAELLQSENGRWCGRVQRVVTGETYDFRGWAELVERLGIMLDDPQAGGQANE